MLTEIQIRDMLNRFTNHVRNKPLLRDAEDAYRIQFSDTEQQRLTPSPFFTFDNTHYAFTLQDAEETALLLNVCLALVYQERPGLERFSFYAITTGTLIQIRLQLDPYHNSRNYTRELAEAFADFLIVCELMMPHLLDAIQKAKATQPSGFTMSSQRDWASYVRWAAKDPSISAFEFERIVNEAINRRVFNKPGLDGKTALDITLISGNIEKAYILLFAVSKKLGQGMVSAMFSDNTMTYAQKVKHAFTPQLAELLHPVLESTAAREHTASRTSTPRMRM